MCHLLCKPSDRSFGAAKIDGDPVLFFAAALVSEAVRFLVAEEPRVAGYPLEGDIRPSAGQVAEAPPGFLGCEEALPSRAARQ